MEAFSGVGAEEDVVCLCQGYEEREEGDEEGGEVRHCGGGMSRGFGGALRWWCCRDVNATSSLIFREMLKRRWIGIGWRNFCAESRAWQGSYR